MRPDRHAPGIHRFRIITGTAFGTHDLAWITKQLGETDDVRIADVTGSFACFGVWGPSARAILERVTSADLSNEAFPYMSAQEIVVGDVPCLAARVTYVGELGWELYPSVEFARSLWDALVEAGEGHGLIPAGYRAIDSLRLEKGYRAWGSDITPEDTPLEAGLGFAVDLREGLPRSRRRSSGSRRPASRDASDASFSPTRGRCAWATSPCSRTVVVVSRVTSGGIGYTLGASIALRLPAIRARRSRHVALGRGLRRACGRESLRTTRSTIRRASASAPEAQSRPKELPFQ